MEALLDSAMDLSSTRADQFGRLIDARDMRELYVSSLVAEHPGLDLSGMKLVMDCANGAASWYAPQVFARLGADIITINASPTGMNINERAGSEHIRRNPKELSDDIQKYQAHFGLVFDGDADRVIFVDEAGNLVDGDHMLAILADYLQSQGRLLAETVVSTTMRNGALVGYFSEREMDFLETPVGDKYIMTELLKLMQKSQDTHQIGLGGEQSGHIILMDGEHATGDGLRTAIYLIQAYLAGNGVTLAAMAEGIQKYPQVIASAFVSRKTELDQLEQVKAIREEIQQELAGLTRLNLRYSGTEPKVRLMLEADNRHSVSDLAQKAFALCEAVQSATGTPAGSFLEVLNVTNGGLVRRV
jgi:phosphoglucosamine mutase